MARLLTLALAETTRNENDYAVVAWNVDEDSWVLIKELPRVSFKDPACRPIWDIFGITEANVQHVSGQRPEVSVLVPRSQPRYIEQVANDERLSWLRKIAVTEVRDDIYHGPNWVGLTPVRSVNDIIVRPRLEYKRGYDPDRTFYWDCRIEFTDGSGESWSAPCKDLRWKTYWVHQVQRKRRNPDEIKHRWVRYLDENETYFIVEIYPPWERSGKLMPGVFGDGSGHYFAVSGILCLQGGQVLPF